MTPRHALVKYLENLGWGRIRGGGGQSIGLVKHGYYIYLYEDNISLIRYGVQTKEARKKRQFGKLQEILYSDPSLLDHINHYDDIASLKDK